MPLMWALENLLRGPRWGAHLIIWRDQISGVSQWHAWSTASNSVVRLKVSICLVSGRTGQAYFESVSKVHPAHAAIGVVEMAAHHLPPHPVQRRWGTPAMRLDLRATLGKNGSRPDVRRDGAPARRWSPEPGHAGPAWVAPRTACGIGVQGLAEEVFLVAGLDKLAGIHHTHSGGPCARRRPDHG